MTLLDLPEPELLPVTLTPVERVTLGAQEALAGMSDRLALGRPLVVPLDPTTVGPEAHPFLAARPDSRFFVLNLSTSFEHDEDNPFVKAWTDVSLTSVTPEGAEDPLAWSMQPMSDADAMTVSEKLALGPDLKIKLGGAVDVGVSADAERSTSRERQLPRLEGLKEGTSRPRWVFSATPSREIRGTHRLRLVVDVPAAATAEVTVAVGATLQLRRLKVFRYEAQLDGDAGATLVIPPG